MNADFWNIAGMVFTIAAFAFVAVFPKQFIRVFLPFIRTPQARDLLVLRVIALVFFVYTAWGWLASH